VKIYLWILHVGGFAIGFMGGVDTERGTWAAALICGGLSIAALCCLVAMRKPEGH
jgi:hypothetical protein